MNMPGAETLVLFRIRVPGNGVLSGKVVLSFFSSKHNNDIMYNYKAPPPISCLI